MNIKPDTPTDTDTLEALDAFEQSWVDALQQSEPTDPARDAAFTQDVLDRWEKETHPPVLAKLGWTPYAAAAAVLIAATVGWAVLRIQPDTAAPGTGANTLAQTPEQAAPDSSAPTRIAQRSQAERRELARSLQLGTMIAGTSESLAKPAAGLPQALDDTADNFSLQALARGLTNPIPDPAQALPPRRVNPRS